VSGYTLKSIPQTDWCIASDFDCDETLERLTLKSSKYHQTKVIVRSESRRKEQVSFFVLVVTRHERVVSVPGRILCQDANHAMVEIPRFRRPHTELRFSLLCGVATAFSLFLWGKFSTFNLYVLVSPFVICLLLTAWAIASWVEQQRVYQQTIERISFVVAPSVTKPSRTRNLLEL
jgi:hypothetical protein